MLTKKFQRNKENFVCENCGVEIRGSGYTNHCSSCLWSKHVDVNPGDRMEKCKGLMEPVGIDSKKGKYVILHKCVVCGYERKNKTVEEDNFDEILKVAGELRD